MGRVLGGGLEAGGNVGGVADRRVLHPPLGADEAGHDRAAVDAHAEAEGRQVAVGQPGVEEGQAGREQVVGGRDRGPRVVGPGER